MKLPTRSYVFAFALLAGVYVAGLFVPLMNNDSAHHANIALHMYLTGDYVSLVDGGADYLDKPHLHFWLSAASYHIFGINGFAYKFPSFLFCILGLFSTYRLGKILYGSEAGRLAALILGTAYAFVLAMNDVRMDMILTSSIIFSIWQLVQFTKTERWKNLVAASLGLALGFSTKGMIGVAMPGIAIILHLLYDRNWKMIFNWKWITVPLFFGLFISPVLYAYYIQYDLHPEKVIYGRDHISGVKYILWSQNIERFDGTRFGNAGKNDPYFFLHTFLWSFLPWSLVFIAAYWVRLRQMIASRFSEPNGEGLTWLTITVIFIIISASSFKLPHYLIILLPLVSVLLASYLCGDRSGRDVQLIGYAQNFVVVALLILTGILNLWFFPVTGYLTIAIALAMILSGLYFHFYRSREIAQLGRIVQLTALTAIVSYFLLNSNFYPQVLRYQAGQTLAKKLLHDHGEDVPATAYLDGFERSNSFDFQLGQIIPDTSIPALAALKTPLMIYTGENGKSELERQDISFGIQYEASEFHVSRLSVPFLRPETRQSRLQKHYLLLVSPGKFR